MKTLVNFIMLALVALCFSDSCFASNPSNDYSMMVYKFKETEESNDEIGRRSSSIAIPVMINLTEGVEVSGFDESDIVSYGIYDGADNCLALYTDDLEFAAHVLSLSGIYIIKIKTADYILCGCIDM